MLFFTEETPLNSSPEGRTTHHRHMGGMAEANTCTRGVWSAFRIAQSFCGSLLSSDLLVGLVLRRSSFIWQGWSMPGKNDGNLHGHQCTF